LLRDPGVLLGSDVLASLLEELAGLCDQVVIDSAPVGPVADALLVAAHVDASLVVARAGRTHRGALQAALDGLEQAGCRNLGVILNDLHLGPLSRYTSPA